MAVTIKDVAKVAGVSPSTVSRVVANDVRISDKTKKKVNKIIKELNYKPNIIARGLANNKTKMIGIAIPSEAEDFFENPFFIYAMKGISEAVQDNGYYLVNSFTKKEDSMFQNIVDLVNSGLIDGVCLLRASEDDKCIEYLNERNFPFSVIGRPDISKNMLWVDNDNVSAMFNAVNNFLEKGHTKIGFLGAEKKLNFSKDRLKGYFDALYSKDIEINTDYIKHSDELSICSGKKMMQELIKEDITAVVATDDMLSLGALEIINKSKKNIKIIGFNNIQLAKFQKPSLSSVDINATQLGYKACKLLINKLEGINENLDNIVETFIIERESSI